MVPFNLSLHGMFVALLSISVATIPSPVFALPDQVFWEHNDWPSDLGSVGSGVPLLAGTVLFAQSQIMPSKHRIANDDQPHLTALKKTLVMLRPHDINDQSVSMELTVRDADGNMLADPILMETPENIPKHEGWVDIDNINFPDNNGSIPDEFPTDLDNPHVISGQTSLNGIGNDPEAVGLTALLNDLQEVEIKTANGSWMNDFYLPRGSDVPSNSKVLVTCDSEWGINVHYSNSNTGAMKMKSLSQGDTLIVILNQNLWLDSEDFEDAKEKVSFEFPTELDNPHLVSGQTTLNTVGDDPKAVGLANLFQVHDEIEVRTANGSWMKNFYLPEGSEVAPNSKIQFTCNSGWGINIYYRNPQTGNYRRKVMAQGDTLIAVFIDNMWLAAEDLEHNDYIFGHNFYSAVLELDWVKPGMSLEFSSSSGEEGVLEADVGGVTELIITTLDAGFLTEPRNEFTFREDPTTNTEYFETTMASRLVVAQYETMQFDEIVLPTGKKYTTVSDDEGGVYAGDMRQFVGKILLSHGIDMANYGVSSSLAQSESPHKYTCALLAAHNTVGMYQNGRVAHGLSGGNGMVTLMNSVGNEFSHEIGHNYGLGHYVGGFDGSVHRGANEINSSWGWDSQKNMFRPNFSPSNTGKVQCYDSECENAFMGRYQYGKDAMAGGEPLWGTNRFTMYTPHVSREIQDFLESKAIWDPSSSTGFRKYNSATREMEEFTNYDNGEKVPSLYRVPVTTIVGYYEPDPSRALESYIYPALHGAYGFVYDDDGGSDTGSPNGCELVVETENRQDKLVYNLNTFIDSKGMNKFHVNVATEDKPTKALLYCKNKLLHTRDLNGPKDSESPLTYTVNGAPFVDPPSTPTDSPTATPTRSPTKSPTKAPTKAPTKSPTSDCEDRDDLELGKKKRNCNWVGKPKNKAKVIKRCKRKSKGIRIWDWCPTTCGEVGLGKCT